MEHIVQFGISIDDEMIQNRLEENAYDDIINIIIDKWTKAMPNKDHWKKYANDKDDIDYTKFTEKAVKQVVNEHTDEIIDLAAEKLCDSFKRTKMFKEKMAESME